MNEEYKALLELKGLSEQSLSLESIDYSIKKANIKSKNLAEKLGFDKAGSSDTNYEYIKKINESFNITEHGITMANVFGLENLDEAFDFKVHLYHGSNRKFKVLKATAYNNGHLLAKPSWSVFFWADKELAKRWALTVVLNEICYNIKHNESIKEEDKANHANIMFVKESGFHNYSAKIFIRKEDEDTYKKHSIGKNLYVYTVSLPIYQIGIGNDSFEPEYTYNGSVTPDKIDTIKITEKLFDEYVTTIASDRKVKPTIKQSYKPLRGLLNPLFRNNEDAIARWTYVKRKIRAKEVKPGDDLDEIFKDYKE